MDKKPPPATVDEYIAGFPEDVQQVLIKIRRIIQEEAPGAVEKIGYQMPGYYMNGPLVYFAAHARHIGFYPTPSGIDALKQEFSDFKWAKGSVQFPLDKPMPYDLIRKMVRFRVAEKQK